MSDPQRGGHVEPPKQVPDLQYLAQTIIDGSNNHVDYVVAANKAGLDKIRTELLLRTISIELDKRKETQLYEFLKQTGRSGIILVETGLDDEDICEGNLQFERKPIDKEHIEIWLNGKKMGSLITDEEDGEKFTFFEPEKGVEKFYKEDLEKEIKK